MRTGVEQDLAKKIVKLLKESKLKVQASIQGDAVRVSGAKKDDLQDAIATGTQIDRRLSAPVPEFPRLGIVGIGRDATDPSDVYAKSAASALRTGADSDSRAWYAG